jgi:hypothetical protein
MTEKTPRRCATGQPIYQPVETYAPKPRPGA